jgi:hypothetical protein
MNRSVKFFSSLLVAAIVLCLAGASFGQTAPASSTQSASLPATLVVWFDLNHGRPAPPPPPRNPYPYPKPKPNPVVMPEGGSPVMYLAVAGLVCLSAAAIVYRKKYAAQSVQG